MSLLKVTWHGRYPRRPVRVLFKVVNQGLLSRWPVKALVQVACQGPFSRWHVRTGALFKATLWAPDQNGLSGALFKVVCQRASTY